LALFKLRRYPARRWDRDDATVELEYDLPMGLFSGIAEKLLGGSIERDLRHSMENFKALCKAAFPAHV
jgi:uncharacterized membrane protein